jgi:hypothetical protein
MSGVGVAAVGERVLSLDWMMSARCCFSPLLLPSLLRQALFLFETLAEAGWGGCRLQLGCLSVGWLAGSACWNGGFRGPISGRLRALVAPIGY